MKINYDKRTFRSITNSANGEVSAATVFHYHQSGDIVWATYSGGAIRFGTLIATVDATGCLDMRYQHVNERGELMTGQCHSSPTILTDGRLRMREHWKWTSGGRFTGDLAAGVSEIEEVNS